MAWLIKVDKNGTKYFADNKCRKCGGKGFIYGYEHIDGARCWECAATGKVSKPYTWKEYTPEYAAKLAERRKKKAIKNAPAKNQMFFKRYGFDESGRTWVVIGNTFNIKDDLKAAGAKFDVLGWHFDRANNGFNCFEISIADVGYKNEVAEWLFNDTCEIAAFISVKQAEHAPKSTSCFVGTVGNNFNSLVVFLEVFSYETHYTYYGETHYIYKFSDENGNIIVWKTTSFKELTAGAKYTLSGKIKEHSEYKGEKQTTLQRCRIA